MEFYTTCVAQRTRLRRLKFEQGSNMRKKKRSAEIDRAESPRDPKSSKSCDLARGSNQNTSVPCASHTRSSYVTSDNRLDHIDFKMEKSGFSVSLESRSFEDEVRNEHKLEKSYRNGCKGVASSSKGDSRKRSRKPVSDSKIYHDVAVRNEHELEKSHRNGCKGVASSSKGDSRIRSRKPVSDSKIYHDVAVRNEHKLETNHRNGCKGVASSSEGDSRIRSRKPVSDSKKYHDVAVIDRAEFLRGLQSSKSYDVARGSNQNTRVPCASHTHSSYDTSDNGLDHMDFEMENSRFSVSKESRSFEDEGTDEDVRVFSKYDGKATESETFVKTESNRFKDIEAEETSGIDHKGENVGFGRRNGKKTTEVQETVIVSSGDDRNEYSNSSDSEGDDLDEYSSSSESEDLDEDLSSSESEYSDEYSNSSESEDSDEYSNSSESEDSEDSDLVVPLRKKRRTESENISLSDDILVDEPIKKSKDKSEKKSRELRNNLSHENESYDKHALKRKELLGRKILKRLVPSPRSNEEEDEHNSEGMHEKRSSCDFDKTEKKSDALRKETKFRKSKPTESSLKRKRCYYEPRQDQLGSLSKRNVESADQINADDAQKEEKDKLNVLQEECAEGNDADFTEVLDKNEAPDHAEEVGEPAREEGGEENKESGETSKKRRVFGTKGDVLGDLLKGILGKGETDEGGPLKEEEEVAATQSSPVKEPIPLKFRFEDEDELAPKEEKSEFELMVDGLFDEMEYGLLQCTEMSSSKPLTAEIEGKNDIPKGEVNDSCRMCKHDEQYFDEQIGIRCHCCKEIILESKYVLPDLVKVNPTTERRGNSYREKEFSRFNGLEFEASGNDSQESSCNHSKGTVWDAVPGIRDQMYPHQQEGFEFIWRNLAGTINLPELKNSDLSGGGGGCVISHSPGTGKTRLTIVFLETYLKLFPNCRPVIIAPVSILLTWEEEFKKWKVKFPFHNLNNLALSGVESLCLDKNLVRVVRMHAWKKGGSVLGVSYNLFEKLAGEKFTKEKGKKKREKVVVDQNLEMLRRILLEIPGLVVLDEGHRARNQRSSIWNSLSNLKTEKCIILSGTPFQNNFGELFNTLRLVRPAIADKLAREKTFDDAIRPRSGQSKEARISLNSQTLDEAIEKLKATIAPFVHVHKGSILQKSLPGLRDCIVQLGPPPIQKHLIEAMENLRRQNTFEYEYKVAMVSVHPSLVLQCRNLSEKEKSAFDRELLEKLRLDYDAGVKTRFLMELIRLSRQLDEKVLIFSQYVLPLEMIKDHLKKVFNWYDEKEVFHLRGNLDQKHRQKMINIFNDPNSKSKVMLASTKCCSEGIHLVGASRVVLLDVVWNPSVQRQAICRAYRLGQKKVVYTYHLMTSGTTEGEKYCRQAQKDRISELVFSASSSSSTATEDGNEKQKDSVKQLDDKILKHMVGEIRLKSMFKKIIYQPKETNLIESFQSESFSIEN